MNDNEDQLKREKIPSRADLPTKYHPCANLLMVIPLADIKQVGNIILPERAAIQLNEGHIVEKGPMCSDGYDLNVGDCVCWDVQSEIRMNVDGVPFILVRESSITMKIPRTELVSDGVIPDNAAAEYRRSFSNPKCSCEEEAKDDPIGIDSNCPVHGHLR